MRLSRIIEIYHEELRFYLVGIQMMKQVIISNLGKVWELIIIDRDLCKTFIYREIPI